MRDNVVCAAALAAALLAPSAMSQYESDPYSYYRDLYGKMYQYPAAVGDQRFQLF